MLRLCFKMKENRKLRRLLTMLIFILSFFLIFAEDIHVDTPTATQPEQSVIKTLPQPQENPEGMLSADFMTGLKLYQNKEFNGALQHFSALNQLHPNNPNIMFNLGLTYYQLGQAGKALAYWRKVLYLEPRFRPAQAALTYTEELLFPQQEEKSFLYPFWLALRSVPFLVWVLFHLVLFFWTGWIALGWYGHRKKTVKSLPLHFYALALLFLLTSALLWQLAELQAMHKATVVSKGSSIRVMPQEQAPLQAELSEGLEVMILNQESDWVLIQTPTGAKGWVQQQDILASHPEPTRT